MDWETWIAFYVGTAIVGAIVANSVISAIREEAQKTRDCLENLRRDISKS